MLVHIKEIIPKAVKGNYAVPAFNTFNLETTLAIVRGAVEKKSPVIIQISEKTIQYAGLKPITHIMETIAKNEAVKVPVALHLDHGKSFHSVAECISAGFSSIHIDASELPFDENVALTKQSTDYAHKNKCWTQGELGKILGQKDVVEEKDSSDLNKYLTDPAQAEKFVKQTKIDTFAPSVGAMHGIFKGQEKIDQNLLKEIQSKTNLPLVLHGASGVSDEDIKLAIKNGVAVINIDTRLREVFTNRLRQTLMSKVHEIDPRNILTPSIEAVQKIVEEKIELFGSAGKA
ncbi:class II fructose-bisphosphate aldolase [Candidatus Parcubacteria bacterium]|nr:class II fructose-bisphosphate aldolase [Patescibacteria group bacterium]MBU4482224.1 class II fructose-bisphosphate aldolase [Patescibacteria group bacterium]MCG2686681.1 class II fructose-bisphosphate aldolase [Candidatus Parcubacteria bacterium]